MAADRAWACAASNWRRFPPAIMNLPRGRGNVDLVIAPTRCFLPAGERHWGIATQLYSLNSLTNWGIGDFGDLRRLVERAAAHGAGAIGLNPLHALFLDAPERRAPLFPSSRLFRNPLYLDVAAISDLRENSPRRAP